MTPRKGATTWMAAARQELARYLEGGTSTSSSAVESTESLVSRHNPKEIYFDAVRDGVALDAPFAVLPSMALPPGHAFAGRQSNGTPVLVYRDKKDPKELRAYVNACSHRGSPLLRPTQNGTFATEPLKAPILTCPYHAWTYDAQSGALKKIPGHEKAFGLMDKDAFGLKALTCREKAGWVWVGGDLMAEHGLWGVDELDSQLQPFLFSTDTAPTEAYKVIEYREWDIAANWQLVVETALESYHVKALHQKTFNLVTHPTWAMFTKWVDNGRNTIMSLPLRNFVAAENDKETPEEKTLDFLGQTTTTCLAFPGTFVSLFKRFLLMNSMEPVDSTSTRIRTWAVPHRLSDLSNDSTKDEAARRDFQNIVAAVEEDWDCVQYIQENINNGAGNEFIYGGYERNNDRFLQNVARTAERLEALKKASKENSL